MEGIEAFTAWSANVLTFFFEDDMLRCCQQEFHGAPVAAASSFFSIQALGPFLTLQVRIREAIRTESQNLALWLSIELLDQWVFLLVHIACLFLLMHLLIWSFQKPFQGLCQEIGETKKKQLTHLTPIILPIISGFHLLPSVFVILFSCASKVRENVNTLRALPSWNSVIYGLHGFEAYKQRGESIWSAYKKKTWIIIRTNLHTPNLCLEGQQQGIMSFIQHFRDWLASWKKMFQVAKELEPLVFQISPLLSKLSATVSLLIWKTTSNPDIHSIWAKFPWKLHPWPWKNRPSNHQWPKSTGLLSHFLAFEGVEVFRNCPKDPKLQTRLRVAVLNIFIILIDIYWFIDPLANTSNTMANISTDIWSMSGIRWAAILMPTVPKDHLKLRPRRRPSAGYVVRCAFFSGWWREHDDILGIYVSHI